MSRYSFFNARPQLSEEKLAKAQVITDLKRELEVTQATEQYVFKADADLSKLFRLATSVEIKVTTLNNGTDVNRVTVILPDGRKFFNIRIWGSDKELVPEKKLSSEEIKKATFGYCTEGECPEGTTPKWATDGVLDKRTGEYVLVRRKYLNIG